MRRQWIVATATSLHFFWGIALLLDPSAALAVPIAAIVQMFGGQRVPSAILLIVSAVTVTLAVLPKAKPELGQLVFVLFQQLLLMISATGAILALASGVTPSGASFPYGELLAGQVWPIALAAWHTVAILDYLMYRGGVRWTRQ